jgi:septal ring factor EnvC (AmiA/AmiB activator)
VKEEVSQDCDYSKKEAELELQKRKQVEEALSRAKRQIQVLEEGNQRMQDDLYQSHLTAEHFHYRLMRCNERAAKMLAWVNEMKATPPSDETDV